MTRSSRFLQAKPGISVSKIKGQGPEATVPVAQAIWRRGLFANQNSACKLSKQFTIDTVTEALGIAHQA